MNKTRRLFGPLAVAVMLLVFTVPALAGPAFQSIAPYGTVLALQGTPHLWIADEQGVVHWGGDTRALAGRHINWADRREVTLDQLRSFRRGDPWLSAGLLKIGDPIYLVKWETGEVRPTLLHIQSIGDVELFGIDSSNYGTFILDRSTWEQRFGINVDSLTKGTLPSAVLPTATPTAVATATPTPSPLVATVNVVRRLDAMRYETEIDVCCAPPGTRLMVALEYEEWNCTPACETTTTGSWGPYDAGPTNPQTGSLRFADRHGPYKAYTYTFTDVKGNVAKVSRGNDLDV